MEFDLIARIAQRTQGANSRGDVALGIGDDAALLRVPLDRELVACCDTLNAGVHFPHDASAFDIGWKALAVNLSDLAAMGAVPAWALLSLTLPEPDAAFVDGLMQGFSRLAQATNIALVGGDTTRGPLALCVTALGLVEPSRALRRDGANVGDGVFVSGTLGDAAAGLRLWQGDSSARGDARFQYLFQRLHRPTPRLALGEKLIGIANCAIDISDGLLADLSHVASASGVGIELDVDALPMSEHLRQCFDEATARRLQLSGGDDYELAFTVPESRIEHLHAIAESGGVAITRIGSVVAARGVRVRDAAGAWLDVANVGWDHFKADKT